MRGTRLRELREARALSQSSVAQRAGVSREYITKIEDGSIRRPSAHRLAMIARALNMDTATLNQELEIPFDPPADDELSRAVSRIVQHIRAQPAARRDALIAMLAAADAIFGQLIKDAVEETR